MNIHELIERIIQAENNKEETSIKLYSDTNWMVCINTKVNNTQTEHYYIAIFTYKNGCKGKRVIRFVDSNGDTTVNIDKHGSGKNIKIKNDIKNLILEFERQYRFRRSES